MISRSGCQAKRRILEATYRGEGELLGGPGVHPVKVLVIGEEPEEQRQAEPVGVTSEFDRTVRVTLSSHSTAEPGPKLRTHWRPSQVKVQQEGCWVLLDFPWEVHAH